MKFPDEHNLVGANRAVKGTVKTVEGDGVCPGPLLSCHEPLSLSPPVTADTPDKLTDVWRSYLADFLFCISPRTNLFVFTVHE